MKIEPWPGGRWYRDLGDNNGHLWGHVQAIKRPTLLEFSGPLFASYPFVSNVQYRLTEAERRDKDRLPPHRAWFIQDDPEATWKKAGRRCLERVRKAAEAR